MLVLALRFIRVPPSAPPNGAPAGGGAWRARKGIPPKIKCQFWGFNSGDFKNDLYFHFIVPTTPARAMAPPGGGLGEARGGFSPILSKIMC